MKNLTITLLFLNALTILSNAQIPNSSFESWTNMGSYYNPDAWSCLNNLTASVGTFTCERGTPGNTGSYYLQLTSKTVTGMGVMPGIAVSGTFDQSTMQPLSGFAFNQRPAKITGSWQHMIFGSSQGYADVQLTRWDITMQMRITVASVHYILDGMEMSWADFAIPLVYMDGNNPDSCIITFSSSGSTPHNYDFLYVDNLTFTGSVAGIDDIGDNKTFIVYPNPAKDQITIENNSETVDEIVTIYNIKGQLILQRPMKQIRTEINISNLEKGVYIIKVSSRDGVAIKKLIK